MGEVKTSLYLDIVLSALDSAVADTCGTQDANRSLELSLDALLPYVGSDTHPITLYQRLNFVFERNTGHAYQPDTILEPMELSYQAQVCAHWLLTQHDRLHAADDLTALEKITPPHWARAYAVVCEMQERTINFFAKL